MKAYEIQIGDCVEYRGSLFSETGVVVTVDYRDHYAHPDEICCIGVDFETDTVTHSGYLHSLDGTLPAATGYYCEPNRLTLIENDTTSSKLVFDFLTGGV